MITSVFLTQYCFVDRNGILWAIIEQEYKPVTFITQDGEALVFAE